MELTLEIRKGLKLTIQTLLQENGENKLKETRKERVNTLAEINNVENKIIEK